MKQRERLWEVLQPAKAGDRLSRSFDLAIVSLILLNVAALVFGSVTRIGKPLATPLYWLEVASLTIFSLEYLARVWSCPADRRFLGFWGRFRFAITPLAIIDLAAILPSLLTFGLDLRYLRILRILRIVRVAKLGRYNHAFGVLGRVLKEKRDQLVATTVIMALLLVLSSCLIYQAEHSAQPDKIPNIPAAMWWAVVTMTTVGYGDVHPITGVGKMLAAVTALLGLGFFALPAGIIGSGFVEAIGRGRPCPHCGKTPTGG